MAAARTPRSSDKRPASATSTKSASTRSTKSASKNTTKSASKNTTKNTTKSTSKNATKSTSKNTTKRASAPRRGRAAAVVVEAPVDDARAARVTALESVFGALGARDPQRWARSHVEQGVDQIGRFVFLRALWTRVVKDGRFLDRARASGSELSPAVHRLVQAGVDEADIVDLVRAMQVQLLVDLCQILDDPNDNDEGVRWGLWRMDKRGLPLWQLPELRLDVLDVDPADDV